MFVFRKLRERRRRFFRLAYRPIIYNVRQATEGGKVTFHEIIYLSDVAGASHPESVFYVGKLESLDDRLRRVYIGWYAARRSKGRLAAYFIQRSTFLRLHTLRSFGNARTCMRMLESLSRESLLQKEFFWYHE